MYVVTKNTFLLEFYRQEGCCNANKLKLLNSKLFGIKFPTSFKTMNQTIILPSDCMVCFLL